MQSGGDVGNAVVAEGPDLLSDITQRQNEKNSELGKETKPPVENPVIESTKQEATVNNTVAQVPNKPKNEVKTVQGKTQVVSRQRGRPNALVEDRKDTERKDTGAQNIAGKENVFQKSDVESRFRGTMPGKRNDQRGPEDRGDQGSVKGNKLPLPRPQRSPGSNLRRRPIFNPTSVSPLRGRQPRNLPGLLPLKRHQSMQDEMGRNRDSLSGPIAPQFSKEKPTGSPTLNRSQTQGPEGRPSHISSIYSNGSTYNIDSFSSQTTVTEGPKSQVSTKESSSAMLAQSVETLNGIKSVGNFARIVHNLIAKCLGIGCAVQNRMKPLDPTQLPQSVECAETAMESAETAVESTEPAVESTDTAVKPNPLECIQLDKSGTSLLGISSNTTLPSSSASDVLPNDADDNKILPPPSRTRKAMHMFTLIPEKATLLLENVALLTFIFYELIGLPRSLNTTFQKNAIYSTQALSKPLPRSRRKPLTQVMIMEEKKRVWHMRIFAFLVLLPIVCTTLLVLIVTRSIDLSMLQ